jgi:glycine/D-amino acid oxidase-like deaminating enzyme
MELVDVEHRKVRRTLSGGRTLEMPFGPQHVWWLQEALAQEKQLNLAPLEKKIKTDVCVVGGGFTGLWAAIAIIEKDPSLSVVLIEKDECGFGASGRNGGWATGWHDEIAEMISHFGESEARRLIERSAWALERIRSFSEEHAIESRFRQSGVLWASSALWQQGMWSAASRAWRSEGDNEAWRELSTGEVQTRTGSPHLLNGAWQRDGATVQPALLVRGLRRAAVRLGVQIYEHTPLVTMSRTTPTKISTPTGEIETDTVILATGAWAANWKELRRSFVPIASHIVATEPIPKRLAELEWSNGVALGDGNQMVHYAQVSADGRIIFGRGGGSIGAFGRVSANLFDNPRTVREVAQDFRRWFPQFHDVALSHGWGGAVDRSPGHLPFVGRFDCDAKILFGAGYSGNGVGPSAYIGRILGHAALGIRDEDTTGGMAQGVPAFFPHEPIRSLGGTVLREAIRWSEGGATPGTNSVAAHQLLARAVKIRVPTIRKPTTAVFTN